MAEVKSQIEITHKKRGRKPKSKIDTLNDKSDILPKKRGRKPKKTCNPSSVSQNQNKIHDVAHIDIELNKTIDFDEDNTTNSNIDISDLVSNIWLNKYQPKTLDDVIDNKTQVNQIKQWLKNYETSNYHTAVISGGHGHGKNLIVKLALSEAGYKIKNIYGSNLKNKNIVNHIISSYAKIKNAYSSYNKTQNHKYAIVIDDTESISLSSEKDNLNELFKLNGQNKYFPLILISNLQHSKLINNFKKISLDINLCPPDVEQIKIFVNNICLKENMKFENNDVIYQIIKFCQSDIRRLLYILQDLFCTYGENIITNEQYKEYQMMSQKKDIDAGLYYAAKDLLNNYKNINKCLELYETEKVLLPLTIYENFYKKVFKYKLSEFQILQTFADVSNSVSMGDVIETNIYSDQNWFLQTIHGFYTCVDTSYSLNLLNKLPNSTIHKKPSINISELVFSADLNKTSSKNINRKKNIIALQTKFKNKNTNDILYINKILFELENKNNSKINKIKSAYDLDTKNIKIALKIDKTNDLNIKPTGKKNKKSNKKNKINNTNDEVEIDCDIDEFENLPINL